jgi:hypothetical protein
MRRVVQDSFGEGHPWFEIEPDKFTCAKNWDAALERRQRQPQGLYTDKSYEHIVALFGGNVVSVSDEYPEVPHDVLW